MNSPAPTPVAERACFLGRPYPISLRALIIVACLLAWSSLLGASPVVRDMTPLAGTAGTPIELLGAGFDPGGSYTVTVAGVAADIANVEEGAIRFLVPEGASSGRVILHTPSATLEFPLGLTVLQSREITFASSIPFDTTDYTAGTLFGDAVADGDRLFVDVADGGVTLVGASRDASSQTLFGVATGSSNPAPLVLDAESTALALLFFTPGIRTTDPDDAEARLATLKNFTATGALINAISAHFASGDDILESDSIEDALVEVVAALFDSPSFLEMMQNAAASSGGVSDRMRDDFSDEIRPLAAGYPRDLLTPGFTGLNRIESKVEGVEPNERGVPHHEISYGAAHLLDPELRHLTSNPLDWSANLYELDMTSDPLVNRAAADALVGDHTSVYARLGGGIALDRLMVPASSATRYIDIVGRAKDWLTNQVMSVSDMGKPQDRLQIPADRDGLYMIRSFSGARFPPQSELLAELPRGNSEALIMLTTNITLAVVEFGFATTGVDALLPKGQMRSLVKSVESSVQRALIREAAHGSLNAETLEVIFRAAARSVVNELVAKTAVEIVGLRGILRMPDFLLKTLNVVGKVSKVAGVVDRVSAVTNLPNLAHPNLWAAQAVEDTLVVVGNPWAPRILSFAPLQGRPGSLVQISGIRLGFPLQPPIVTFGVMSTDPENPPFTARAELVNVSSTSLVVRVPENAVTGPITVTTEGRGSTTSAHLAEGRDIFTVIPPPVVTGIEPDPPFAGGRLVIFGENFEPFRTNNVVRSVPGTSPSFERVPSQASTTMLRTSAPNTVSTLTARVEVSGGSASDAFSFTPVQPEPQDMEQGAVIHATTHLDNNVRDFDISLREAMMLASGALLYDNLTLSEQEHVDRFGDNFPGAANRDRIRSDLIDGPIVLNAPLPPLHTGTTIEGTFTIDGSQVGGDGLLLDNVSGVSLNNLTLVGFSGNGVTITNGSTGTFIERIEVIEPGGHGIHITGGSSGNLIGYHLGFSLGVTVEDAGGHGVFLDGDASFNNLVRIDVMRSEGHGIYFSGPGVRFNLLGLPNLLPGSLQDNQGWGVLVDGGASYNSLRPFEISSNSAGGIRITGSDSVGNDIRAPDLSNTFFLRILDNDGPGVLVESPETHVEGPLLITGNDGHGIHVRGEDAHDIRIGPARIGYWSFNDVEPTPNQGSGIAIEDGAHRILIGERISESTSLSHRVNTGGNRDHGILLQGPDVSEVTIQRARIGFTDHITDPRPMPNGEHGIALIGGVQGFTIGNRRVRDEVEIRNHMDGAGIYLAGSGTSGHIIQGCVISENRVGIHLTDGAHGNRVGARGSSNLSSPHDLRFRPGNELIGNLEAAILLESGGDPDMLQATQTGEQEPFTPFGGNVIQNNLIDSGSESPTQVGIWIRDGARANRIGGSFDRRERNTIRNMQKAGIHIDGVSNSILPLSNRILGNVISQTTTPDTPPGNPLDGPPPKVGILVDGGTSGQVVGSDTTLIGGINRAFRNTIGVYVDGSSDIRIQHNEIGSATGVNLGNRIAGIVVRDSSNIRVGPGNALLWNGGGDGALGGIVLHRGQDNWVVGNHVGIDAARSVSDALDRPNLPHGIHVIDSKDNQIGALLADGGNTIVSSGGHGIHITGSESTGNRIQHNEIGFTTYPLASTVPNEGDGIRIGGGASDNIVGGYFRREMNGILEEIPAGNVIFGNEGTGVRVNGSQSQRNRILYNVITGHALNVGIQTTSGGNAELPPPTITHTSESPAGLRSVHGTVDQTRVPDGSIVQIFTDPLAEGQAYQASAEVVGGAFSALLSMPVFDRINATVTHAATGDTSAFGTSLNLPEATLDVRRLDGEPPRTTPILMEPAQREILAIRLFPLNLNAVVESMRFEAGGDLDFEEATTGFSLYRNEPRSGFLGTGDTLLAGPEFPDEEGMVSFDFNMPLEANRSEVVILAVDLTGEGEAGQSFQLVLQDATRMTSRGFLPAGTLQETGNFPVQSDTFTLGGAPASFFEWSGMRFTQEELQDEGFGDPFADPGSFNIPVLLRYAFDLDARAPDSTGLPQAGLSLNDADGTSFLSVTFTRRTDVDDIEYIVFASDNLLDWEPLGDEFQIEIVPDEQQGVEVVTVRDKVAFDESSPRFLRVAVGVKEP